MPLVPLLNCRHASYLCLPELDLLHVSTSSSSRRLGRGSALHRGLCLLSQLSCFCRETSRRGFLQLQLGCGQGSRQHAPLC